MAVGSDVMKVITQSSEPGEPGPIDELALGVPNGAYKRERRGYRLDRAQCRVFSRYCESYPLPQYRLATVSNTRLAATTSGRFRGHWAGV